MTSSGRVSMTSFGSGQISGRALTGLGQKSGSGVDRIGSKNPGRVLTESGQKNPGRVLTGPR